MSSTTKFASITTCDQGVSVVVLHYVEERKNMIRTAMIRPLLAAPRVRGSSMRPVMSSGMHYFSSSSKEDDKPPEGFIASTKHQIMSVVFTPQNQFYALVAGGSVGAYFISRAFLQFTSFFTHLTPTVVAKWGFYTGFGTASCKYFCHFLLCSQSSSYIQNSFLTTSYDWLLLFCHYHYQQYSEV